VTQSPYKFSAAAAGVRGPSAYRGEHNYDALEDWAGVSKTELDALHESGILLQEEKAAKLTRG
jgi:crotonobetainyl-CoA:carnitine CoA-transferase CaiB-like acyl-CoA transferase